MEKLFSIEKIGDVNIIKFQFNELSLDERSQLKQDLEDLNLAGEDKFIIDVAKVGFISSLVIATIVFFAKDVRSYKGEVKISGLSKEAKEIFTITHLDKIFELYEVTEDAKESFRKR